MNKAVLFLIIFALSSNAAVGHGEEKFSEAEYIIQGKFPCEQLTDDQLDIVGDYYMEQMHPGETHEVMDEMMGGEGSESLREMHIRMAKAFYCGEHEAVSADMMDTVMGRSMMGDSGLQTRGGMMNMMHGFSMMGGTGMFGASLYGLIYLALAAFVFSLIFWLTYNWIAREEGPLKKRK